MLRSKLLPYLYVQCESSESGHMRVCLNEKQIETNQLPPTHAPQDSGGGKCADSSQSPQEGN